MDAINLQKPAGVSAMLDPKIVIPAIGSAFVKLDPRAMIRIQSCSWSKSLPR